MLRCNGNAHRMCSPFDEAGYSEDGVPQPVTETHQEDSQSNQLSDELVTTGEILQSSRLSNELTNTGGDLSDGEVQSLQLSNELVITGEVSRSGQIRDRQSYGVHLALHHGPAGNSHYVRDVSRVLLDCCCLLLPPRHLL